MFLLASRSPQRQRILKRLGVSFQVTPSSFDEAAVTECNPKKRALLLAEGKAKDVAEKYPDQWVIGADTLVVTSDETLLEKPVNASDAERMLRLHSGRTSTVYTALCLCRGEECHAALSTASVTFRKLSDENIAWWIGTDLWKDRSGAFQLENDGRKLVEQVDGEEETVIGFPIALFRAFCRRLELS